MSKPQESSIMHGIEPIRSRRGRGGRSTLELYRELIGRSAGQLSDVERMKLAAVPAELLHPDVDRRIVATAADTRTCPEAGQAAERKPEATTTPAEPVQTVQSSRAHLRRHTAGRTRRKSFVLRDSRKITTYERPNFFRPAHF